MMLGIGGSPGGGSATRKLRSLSWGVLSKLLVQPSSLLVKKFLRDGDGETVDGALPELPGDILMEIFALLQIPDLVRAGSVCSSWHAAYSCLRTSGQYKRQQTPCLLYTSKSASDNVACLYSLEEKRAYWLTLPDPPIQRRSLIGCSHGWLITADERSEMHLLNPITGKQIALPSVTTMKHVTPIFDDSGALAKYQLSSHITPQPITSIEALGIVRDIYYIKAFLFYDDTRIGGYIVVLIHAPYAQLSFARSGDEKWTWLPPHRHFNDCIYKDGLLYAVTTYGEIHSFDIRGPTVIEKLIMGETRSIEYSCERTYIVQATCGNMLQVWRYDDDDYEGDNDADPATYVQSIKNIEVFDVDIAAGKLTKKTSLDGHVLFLGHNQSLCLNTDEYPILKANHAYFTDDDEDWTKHYKNNRRNIGVLNLNNGEKEELVSPQLWSNWPTPVWITPNL